MNDICKSEAERVLMVEGKDDCHVIVALAQHYRLAENFGICHCSNDANVLKRLNALILSPDPVRPRAIGVVLEEAECGHHYARAMASWAAVLALSGFRYHGGRRVW